MERVKPGDKSHETKNVVVTCMDHRYQESIRDILAENDVDIDNVDRLSIGGSSKGVVDGTFLPSIKIAEDAHRAEKVWIFDHIDCGGFGFLKAFGGDVQKEADAHFESLDRAQEAIHKVLPDILVVTYVIGLDGSPIAR